MVLGLRSKSKKFGSVQVDYLVHLQEIEPWPPSQSLRSVCSVLLQWENGDLNSGSLASAVVDGKIEFNESFRIPVTLYCESSKKGTTGDSFQKNYLELYLYEVSKEKQVKGQLLGSAIINLADYGIIKQGITISATIHFKKSSKNMSQSILYLDIEPFYKDNSSSSSSKSSLLKEVSSDKDGSESFSEMTNEGNDEECEITTFTDNDEDDISSHSSWRKVSSSAIETAGGSPAQNCKSGSDSLKNGIAKVNGDHAFPSILAPAKEEMGVNADQVSLEDSRVNLDDRITQRHERSDMDIDRTSYSYVGPLEDKEKKEHQGNVQDNQFFEAKKNSLDDKPVSKFPEVTLKREIKLRSNTLANSQTSIGALRGTVVSEKLKHVKSQLHFESDGSNRQLNSSEFVGKEKKSNIAKDVYKAGIKIAETVRDGITKGSSDSNFDLRSKIEMLEEELREAAALEVGLYSVVAEHGSSANKVHAPARRLSRFYFHAFQAMSKAKRASAARTATSGLILVSKACGNDVPRLTFWLSNSVLLRAIVSQVIGRMQFSGDLCANNGVRNGLEESFVPNWHESSTNENEKNNVLCNSDDWENPQTFIVALEKLEAWIFSRIVKSVWWQTLTPHMQSAAAKASSSRKASGRRNGLSGQEQGNLSIDLWKKAFKDACERLCPVRAGGHECGCLPVLAKLVMKQLVGRLDVAMFNAILRESDEEMPTDPVSDPISDSKVLPIPAGKSSFGAGAQLKNAIGNWSRWLTVLFDIDDNDSLEDMNQVCDDKNVECDTSFKPFPLLNALSDLMMLPCEMLADSSTRKEVCPTLSVPVITRVLNNFVPDAFSPDPIPAAVFETLDSEVTSEAEEEPLTSFPCMAAPTIYSPPPAAALSGIVGEVGNQSLQKSGSTVLRKSYTSDDELDELDSSITSSFTNNSHTSPSSAAPNEMAKGKGGRKVVRYQLLREVWKDGEQRWLAYEIIEHSRSSQDFIQKQSLRMSSRRRPLHTSFVAILSIAHIAHRRSQDFTGPLGSMARKLTRLSEFACPLIYALQAILSFGDDLFLDIENRIETIFPPSKHVFNKTDKLIEFGETLPGMFDDAVKECIVIIHRYSILDWVVNQVISWLNYWISMQMHLEFGQANEKEIRVDANSKECKNESPKNHEKTAESSPPNNRPKSLESDTGNVDLMANKEVTKKGSYKEVLLEKGKREKENFASKDEGKMKKTRKQGVR